MNRAKKIIRFLLSHNVEQSKRFCSPDESLWRIQYRAKHPTEIAALKCMDGRLNLSVMTKTPLGIIQPFRNIGGKFDIGWPFFGKLLQEWVGNSIAKGSDCVILVTYHFSHGDKHRGCRGFNYDTKAAERYTSELKRDIEDVFGKNHAVVYPIQVGIETDEDALILHGEKGEILNLSKVSSITDNELRVILQRLYPDMKQGMVENLLPLLAGNIEHIKEIRAAKRPVVALNHTEQVLAVGRGFDWLHLPNKALIIGPYSYNLAEPIATAGKILLENLRKGRVPRSEGLTLLASAVYREEEGPEQYLAAKKAESLARFSIETLAREVPGIIEHLDVLAGVVNLNTRSFTPIALSGKALG